MQSPHFWLWLEALPRMIGTRVPCWRSMSPARILFHAIPASGLGHVPVAFSAFLAGIGGVVWVISVSAYQQAAVPGPTLGCAVASYRWIGWSAFFAGSIIAGPLADHLGFTGAFAVFASLNIVILVGFPFVIPNSQVLDEPLIA